MTQRFSRGVKPFVPAGRAFTSLCVWTMLSQPGVQSVIVILLIRKDRHETRKVVWGDLPEQEWCRHPIIKTRTGKEQGFV